MFRSTIEALGVPKYNRGIARSEVQTTAYLFTLSYWVTNVFFSFGTIQTLRSDRLRWRTPSLADQSWFPVIFRSSVWCPRRTFPAQAKPASKRAGSLQLEWTPCERTRRQTLAADTLWRRRIVNETPARKHGGSTVGTRVPWHVGCVPATHTEE